MKHINVFENFDMRQSLCQRCYKNTNGVTTMSIFNTDVICLDCCDAEKKDPDYKLACEIEANEWRNGNHNFTGMIPNYKPLP